LKKRKHKELKLRNALLNQDWAEYYLKPILIGLRNDLKLILNDELMYSLRKEINGKT